MAYFANGTEGMHLERQCDECPIGRDPDAACPVLRQCMTFNYDQLAAGQESLRACLNMAIGEDGDCLMKVAVEKAITRIRKREWLYHG